MAGGENTSGLFLCPVLGGRYALGGVHSKISMTPFKFADYYEMKIPNATCLAQRYGITRQAADKRLKKIEEKIKKLVAIF